jgi:uncharacterized membrane protein
MAKIEATEERVFNVTTSPEKAYAFFSQPEQLRQAMDGVERCEVLAVGMVRWVLAEKRDQGIRFQPDYVVVIRGDGARHITWRTVEGNMGDVGEVWVDPLPDGGSRIRYVETVEPDMPVTPLLARLIKPLVARELRNDLSRFLQRAQQILSN